MELVRRNYASCVLLILISLMFIAISGCERGVNQESAKLETNGGGLTLNVEAPRPLATAVRTLVERYGYLITYEDPRYVFSGDLQDVAWRVSRDFFDYLPGKAPELLVPFGGKLVVKSSTTDPADLLAQLVLAQSTNAHGGRFRVVQTENVFHVIPSQAKDRDGNWMAQRSVLDVPISILTQDRTDAEIIDSICAAVSKANHINVISGANFRGGLMSDDGPAEYSFGATNESARSVLMRALEIIAINRVRLTWLLYYSPEKDHEEFVLNLFEVPQRPSSTKPQATMPGTTSNDKVNPFKVKASPACSTCEIQEHKAGG